MRTRHNGPYPRDDTVSENDTSTATTTKGAEEAVQRMILEPTPASTASSTRQPYRTFASCKVKGVISVRMIPTPSDGSPPVDTSD